MHFNHFLSTFSTTANATTSTTTTFRTFNVIFLLNGDERAARKRFSDNAFHSPPPSTIPLHFPLSSPFWSPFACAASFNFHKLSALNVRLCSAWVSVCYCCCCTAIVAGELSGRRAVAATVAIELIHATYSIASPRSDDVWQPRLLAAQLNGDAVSTTHWCGVSFYGWLHGQKRLNLASFAEQGCSLIGLRARAFFRIEGNSGLQGRRRRLSPHK